MTAPCDRLVTVRPTKILICGDRNWIETTIMRSMLERLKAGFSNLVVIHGAARGADSVADLICQELRIPCEVFPADWNTFGRAAGPIRNKAMLDQEPLVVVAFHNNLEESKGTAHTVREADKRGIPVIHVSLKGVK